MYITRGTGTILYVGGPTNQNKYGGKSGGGDQYIGGPLDIKEGVDIPLPVPPPPCCSVP